MSLGVCVKMGSGMSVKLLWNYHMAMVSKGLQPLWKAHLCPSYHVLRWCTGISTILVKEFRSIWLGSKVLQLQNHPRVFVGFQGSDWWYPSTNSLVESELEHLEDQSQLQKIMSWICILSWKEVFVSEETQLNLGQSNFGNGKFGISNIWRCFTPLGKREFFCTSAILV